MIKTGKVPVEMSAREIGEYKTYMHEDVLLSLAPDPVPFQRIRRITGYLVGDLGRFNNAKRREVDDRVKHMGV